MSCLAPCMYLLIENPTRGFSLSKKDNFFENILYGLHTKGLSNYTSFAIRIKHLRGGRRTPRTAKDLPATSPRRNPFGLPSEVDDGKSAKLV